MENPATKNPDEQPVGESAKNLSREEYAPAPGEFWYVVKEWSKRYWDADRAKSKWTDIGMLILTALVATAAFWSAFIFQRQLDASTQNFMQDERASIGLEPIRPPTLFAPQTEKSGTAFKFEIYPKNFGKTVAYKVIMRAAPLLNSEQLNADTAQMNMIQDKMLFDKNSGTPFPVSPIPKSLGAGVTAPVPYTVVIQGPSFYPNGAYFWYLIGRVDYIDIFKVNHWLKFCFFVSNKQGELRSCQEGNDEDQNAEIP